MKKTWKWPSYLIAALLILPCGSCQEWGQMDPPAGTDVYPKKELVAEYNFDTDEFDPQVMQTYAYSGGNVPKIVDDADLGSEVLHLNGGYACFSNPMLNSSAQTAVSMTFWVKQAQVLNEETQLPEDNDVNGALISFQNETGTQRMFITANGWLRYEAVDGEYEANNPSEALTGMLPNDGAWHYVGLIVNNNGYTIYVDNMKKVEKYESNFDFSKIVQFMASVPYLYIGYGSDTQPGEMWMDEISVYRNEIGTSEITRPGSGGQGGGVDYRTYITVGSEDCSTAWWTAFSDLVRFKNSAHFGFYNYNNNTTNNWCNWLIVVTNGKNRDEEGYAEYFVLRSDAYGWGDANYNGANITHNFIFDDQNTFNLDMNGAYVDLNLTRDGNTINMNTVVTTASGTVYNYSFNYTGQLEETISAFLTCEGSYLQIDAEDVYTEGESFKEGSYLVGSEDCSDGFWSSFSDYYIIDGDTEYPFGFIFTNTNNGAVNNWENWILAVANGERNSTGYTEFLILRADAYGWGTIYATGTLTSGFNWDTFMADMDGAYVRLFVERAGETLSTTAKTRTAAGSTLTDYTFTGPGITSDQLYVFLSLEKSCLDIHKVGYFPFASLIEK